MRKFPRFQIDKDKAFEDIIIKDQINIKVLIVKRNAMLPSNEREPSSKFQQKFLQMVYQRLFKI